MTRVKVGAFRELSLQEIQSKETALRKDLFDLRQKKITGQLDKPHQFKAARRQIAQLNTVKREKQNDGPQENSKARR